MTNTNKTKVALLIALTTLLMTGCASKEPFVQKYEADKSVALNIANHTAINLRMTIRDTKVPVGTKQHLANTTEFGLLNTAIMFKFPAAGISGLAGGGLGLLEMLTAPKEHTQNVHVVGWLPVEEASSHEEAQDLLFQESIKAIKQTIIDHDLIFVRDEYYEDKKRGVVVYAAIVDGYEGCVSSIKKDECAFISLIMKPIERKVIAPKELFGEPVVAYFFRPTGERDNNSKIYMQRGKELIKSPEIMQSLSKHLPDWTALYVPQMTRKETIGTKYPYILRKGKFELFIVEDDRK